MVEVTYNLGTTEQGSYDEDGSEVESTTHLRTDAWVTVTPELYHAKFEASGIFARDWEGDLSGDTTLGIAGFYHQMGAHFDRDPNFKYQYYHYVITRSTYTSAQGDNNWRVGLIVYREPIPGGKHDGELPYIYTTQDIAYTGGYGSSHGVSNVVEFSASGNTLVYREYGTLYRTTVAQFCLGSVLHFTPSTDEWNPYLQAERESDIVPLKIAALGCWEGSHPVLSERWLSPDIDNELDFSYEIPLTHFKFVVTSQDEDKEMEARYELLKATITLSAEEWHVVDSELYHTDLASPIPPFVGGAFYNVEELEQVYIPPSVTSIGETTFQGTHVSEVCISRECQYAATSFPEGCRITFYEDLYDSEYQIYVGGTNSYRVTNTSIHDEESTTCEIP